MNVIWSNLSSDKVHLCINSLLLRLSSLSLQCFITSQLAYIIYYVLMVNMNSVKARRKCWSSKTSHGSKSGKSPSAVSQQQPVSVWHLFEPAFIWTWRIRLSSQRLSCRTCKGKLFVSWWLCWQILCLPVKEVCSHSEVNDHLDACWHLHKTGGVVGSEAAAPIT